MSQSRITKAVIPAAGLGTRFLPATKALPKEMLPVVDRPVIQYVVEEAVGADMTDILMITGRNKTTIENHFDRVVELEGMLAERGQQDRLDAVTASSHLADVHYVRQGDPLGLGHAVLRAKPHVGREPFAVLLGDDIIDNGDELLRHMAEVEAQTGASVVALMEVTPEEISAYGCAMLGERALPGGIAEPDLVSISGFVEKPAPEDAPSNLAIIGRYVLQPEVFDVLEHTPPGRGGEIQLTDALNEIAKNPDSNGVVGVIVRGRRFDTGDKLGYITAVVELASRDPELGPRLRAWLEGFVNQAASEA